MAFCLSAGMNVCYRGNNLVIPSASLSLRAGSRIRTSVSVKAKSSVSSGILHCSFTSSPLSLSSSTSYAGTSLGFNFKSSTWKVDGNRRAFVVRASKYRLCQTKRNRSRKSLARTHGFRKRMSTTRGRAVLKRRRDKGRKILCTKTNPNSGKRA